MSNDTVFVTNNKRYKRTKKEYCIYVDANLLQGSLKLIASICNLLFIFRDMVRTR